MNRSTVQKIVEREGVAAWLKKISLPANLVFQLILFITNPENNIGYEED